MKFQIRDENGNIEKYLDILNHYNLTIEKVAKNWKDEINPYFNIYFIEVFSLEELIKLKNEFKCSITIASPSLMEIDKKDTIYINNNRGKF